MLQQNKRNRQWSVYKDNAYDWSDGFFTCNDLVLHCFCAEAELLWNMTINSNVCLSKIVSMLHECYCEEAAMLPHTAIASYMYRLVLSCIWWMPSICPCQAILLNFCSSRRKGNDVIIVIVLAAVFWHFVLELNIALLFVHSLYRLLLLNVQD